MRRQLSRVAFGTMSCVGVWWILMIGALAPAAAVEAPTGAQVFDNLRVHNRLAQCFSQQQTAVLMDAFETVTRNLATQANIDRSLANQRADLAMWLGGIMIAGFGVVVGTVIALRPR